MTCDPYRMEQIWQDWSTELIIVGLYLLSGLLNLGTRKKTAEQWVAFCERRPRLAALVRVMRAVGLDPVKVTTSILQLFQKRVQKELAEKKDEIAKPAEEQPPDASD